MLQLEVKHVFAIALITNDLVPALDQLVATRAHLVHHIVLALPDRRVLVGSEVTDNYALLRRGAVQVGRILSRDIEVGPIVLHLDGLRQRNSLLRKSLSLDVLRVAH